MKFIIAITLSTLLLSSGAFAQNISTNNNIQPGWGAELFYIPCPYGEAAIKINNSPFIVRGKIGYLGVAAYLSTEIAVKKFIFNKLDIFSAISASFIWSSTSFAGQFGIDIPNGDEGHFWRMAVAYGKFNISEQTDGDKEFEARPVLGFGYRY